MAFRWISGCIIDISDCIKKIGEYTFIYVFRSNFLPIERLREIASEYNRAPAGAQMLSITEHIKKATSELVSRASFKRRAPLEEAPEFADCLTSIHYIFKQALNIDLSLTLIGDMPRQLYSLSGWRCLRINIEDAQCGDILFLKDKRQETYISHAAMIIGVNKIFHCCRAFGKAVIQSNEDFFSMYEQRLNFKEMISYIDSRNEELRLQYQGVFVSS